MKGIYLTQEDKQEIEHEIAELEKYEHSIDDIENCSDEDYFYIGKRSGEILKLKEILSSAIILPVEKSWESASDTIDNNQDELLTNCLSKQFPNGIIIQSKL
jgi:hypothetical protein